MQYPSVYTLAGLFLLLLTFSACDDLVLPGVGDLEDMTPPAADFAASPSESAYREITFNNRSISATDFLWNFGDGATSAEENPTHTYADDGDYTVTLTASDKLNATDQTSQVISVVEPVVAFTPVILNPGFDEPGDDDYRDHWRNSDLGGPIQITSSPIHDGVKAAKLPSDGSRIGYQLIKVEANKEYTISFYYTMKTSPEGNLKVAILSNQVENPDDIEANTISSVTLNDQSSASDYVLASVTFESGEHTEVAIYFSNTDVESRIDSFTIVEN